ncbi:TldD/PmbA family protein [Aestuariivirga litoralis]|uniref:TldD/PmbA family protein n=1 Tax=Aestuariivirga litoralis TaxID=2650924 RepID=UPI0018C5870E|nr:TldD/PmbA family protein [Aestuariivirga litoralis]MBG1233433.1 TldD/PmbA family protein [Aestuariivirga litoralis]
MNKELLELAEDTLALALKAGATSGDAMVVEQRDSSISMREGKIEELEQSESRGVGLRIFAGQSSATIAGSVLTKDARRTLAERAVAMAKLAPPDPFSGLAAPEQLAKSELDLDLVSQTYPTAAQLKQMTEEAEAAGLAVKGISKSGAAGASSSSSDIALASSNGFAKSYRRTGFGLHATLIAGEGTNMVRDYYGTSACHFSDLENPAYVGRMAAERTVKALNPQKLKSQAVPVIFDRRVAASLLGHLAGAINGAAIARGVSFLKEKLEQQVFKPGITIVDDPHRLRGFASKSFDGEGLATQRRNFIDKGVLTSWVLDLRAARQLNLQSTGSASRGLSSQPSPSTTNLHMEPGTQSKEDMIKSIKKGLLITDFIGSSINGATGDYSRGVGGFWIENGEIQYPVSEITVAGNLIDMFLNLTPATDLEFRSSTNAPSCLVEGMTLAGR